VSRVDAVQVARWASGAGFTYANLEVAVAVGLANGSDPAKPGGVWGVGGPANDGAGQAATAHQLWDTKGWAEFPAYRSGAWRLYTPQALIAINVAGLTKIASGAAQAATGPPQAAVSTAESAATFASIAAYSTTEEFRVRGVKIGLGLALIGIGVTMITWGVVMRPFLEALGWLDERVAESQQAVRASIAENQVFGSVSSGKQAVKNMGRNP